MNSVENSVESAALADRIKAYGHDLGFAEIRITSARLPGARLAGLKDWLALGYHGEMHYMARQPEMRANPGDLMPGTRSVITARMDYWPQAYPASAVLQNPALGYISRYALGRDYHKVLRHRLQKLATQVERFAGHMGYRVFTDSAPVMEVALASEAGSGWQGKHSLLINRSAGSWFFLGEILTSLTLPADPPVTDHCGSCRACLDACPTGAIVAPGRVDARRCISYLTIELREVIPLEIRPLIGNRIYGCDDCQLCCPWNRFAKITVEADFAPRHQLDATRLVDLLAWTQQAFEQRLAGSAIRRIGHAKWLSNIAIALGNAPKDHQVSQALAAYTNHPNEIVRESVAWALAKHT